MCLRLVRFNTTKIEDKQLTQKYIYTDEDRQICYANLRRLLNDYSDEIPKEIVHSTDDNNKFKVRTAWWAAVGANLRILITEGLITNPDLVSKIKIFLLKKKEEMTTQEDIKEANQIINDVLTMNPH